MKTNDDGTIELNVTLGSVLEQPRFHVKVQSDGMSWRWTGHTAKAVDKCSGEVKYIGSVFTIVTEVSDASFGMLVYL